MSEAGPSRIRTFYLPEDETHHLGHSAPDELSLARKGGTYLLVHASPSSSPSENGKVARQHSVINSLLPSDPFPDLEEGRLRLWLKQGYGKPGEDGGENSGLLGKLVEAGVARE